MKAAKERAAAAKFGIKLPSESDEEAEALISLSSDDSYVDTAPPPPKEPGKRGRPPTTGRYVGLWAQKKAAAEAEAEAPIKYPSRPPSKPVSRDRPLNKSLEVGILEANNLAALKRELELCPSSSLMEQLDSALKDVVYISDCFGNLKENFVKTLRKSSKRAKVVACLLEESARDQLGELNVRAERSEINRLKGVNPPIGRDLFPLGETRLQVGIGG